MILQRKERPFLQSVQSEITDQIYSFDHSPVEGIQEFEFLKIRTDKHGHLRSWELRWRDYEAAGYGDVDVLREVADPQHAREIGARVWTNVRFHLINYVTADPQKRWERGYLHEWELNRAYHLPKRPR